MQKGIIIGVLFFVTRVTAGSDDDPGEPLFLTPLIEIGKLLEARSAAQVPSEYFASVPSFSGYLTVNKEYNSNLFFWYFPAKVNAEKAPLILWLQGGPGVSSFFSLFLEHGPIKLLENNTVVTREYSWNNYFNVIYIDNPVGTGFSFTENDIDYAKDPEDIARNLYEAVKQLYQLFPEFEKQRFYVAGASYAGKYVPAFGYKLHKVQADALVTGRKLPVKINLAGLIIGNGYSDPITQINYGQNLYNLGLIDESGLETFRKSEAEIRNCIRKNDSDCYQERIGVLISGSSEGTVFTNLTGFINVYNFLDTEINLDKIIPIIDLVENQTIRRGLHVGNNTYELLMNARVKSKLRNDQMHSVASWVAEMLNHYRVCIFHGQMDLLIPYRPTVRYLQKLKFNGAESYRVAKRKVWRVDDELAGYVKEGGNLVEVLIRNAGHLAVGDQPKWTLDMIKKFIDEQPF